MLIPPGIGTNTCLIPKAQNPQRGTRAEGPSGAPAEADAPGPLGAANPRDATDPCGLHARRHLIAETFFGPGLVGNNRHQGTSSSATGAGLPGARSGRHGRAGLSREQSVWHEQLSRAVTRTRPSGQWRSSRRRVRGRWMWNLFSPRPAVRPRLARSVRAVRRDMGRSHIRRDRTATAARRDRQTGGFLRSRPPRRPKGAGGGGGRMRAATGRIRGRRHCPRGPTYASSDAMIQRCR